MKLAIFKIQNNPVLRPYYDELMAIGKTDGKGLLDISPRDYRLIWNKYRHSMPPNIVLEEPKPTEEKPRLKGVGDVIALIAQPIAKGIDKVLGTNVADCQGCKKRQHAWNERIPFNNT